MKKILFSTALLFCLFFYGNAQAVKFDFGDIDVKEVSEFISKKNGYKKIVINYPSVDAQGKTVILSGAIYMSRKSNTFDNLLLYCHQTSMGNDEVPSGTATFCLETGMVRTMKNSVCFASDYLGFGASAQYSHPYMNNTLAARNELDMMKAGIKYLQDSGYTIKSVDEGLETYVFGYSQGGSVALAVHKALEEDKKLCKDLNFCGSLCGAGPYSLRITFQKFLDDGTMALPLVLPYVLYGMYLSYPEYFSGIDIYDFMTQKCKDEGIIEYFNSKPEMGDAMKWVSKKIGSNIDDIMSEEALNLDSKIMKALYKALDKQNLLDGSWTPEHPIVLYHSENDNIVSYQNTAEALKKFPSNVCRRYPRDKNKYHMLEYFHFSDLCVSKGIPYLINN